ncbi:hypothetical protein NJ76_24940 [Rhodococcus sp. IITR03]|nr:hypothetical protein NJ76_24940 [Rhodococcus sp. IITR03]
MQQSSTAAPAAQPIPGDLGVGHRAEDLVEHGELSGDAPLRLGDHSVQGGDQGVVAGFVSTPTGPVG